MSGWKFGNNHTLPGDNIIDFDFNDFNDFKVFAKSGLHFIHLNINSILPKIDELRLIAHKSHAAVIGITESKIDDSVPDGEIMIEGYVPIRSDRDRQGDELSATLGMTYPSTKLTSNQTLNTSF